MVGGMKHRRILLLLALAAVAVGLVLFWPRGPKEPVYNGKTLGLWLREAVAIPDEQTEALAQKAINAIGTNALPFLLYEFTLPESKLADRVNQAVSALHLSRLKMRTARERRMVAGHGLYLLGPDAAPALPAMAKHMGNPADRFDGVALMARCGAKALPFFLKGIFSTNHNEILGATLGLGRIAKSTESAVAPLMQMLDHTNSEVRAVAAVSLGIAELRPEVAIPALTNALCDAAVGVQFGAAHSLGRYGESARPAVPQLLRLLNSPDANVASMARDALQRIDSAALPARGP